MAGFDERHPKFKETKDKIIGKTNEVLETVGEKASALAKKIESTSAFQSLSEKLKRAGAAISAKASSIAGETGRRVEAQEEALKH
mgnify:CR=1 FL=1